MTTQADGTLRPQDPGRDRASLLDRWLLRAMMGALPGAGYAVQLWDGTREGPSGGICVHIRDRGALWQVMRNPPLHLGDLYAAGRIEIEGDLVTFLERTYAATEAGRSERRMPWGLLWTDTVPRPRTVRAARENAREHYDVGNEFYSLWLDAESMQYTCAYFPEPGMTLEAAQRAKMDHVCRKLRLRPGQRVFEAGSGWGGFALHMAREYGVTVQAWNVSREQVRHAQQEARRQGLHGRVTFIEDDYREMRGECDAFVSVGMLEHVGPENYPALGAVIDRCLGPHGFGLIHTIGRNRPMAMNPWIERRIFPGAHPPSLGQMAALFEPHALSILDVENLRLHYAETLRHWLARYLAAFERVRTQRGTEFARAWHLYLAGSVAGFTGGWMQLFQVVFARARNNDLPASRRHLYP